MEILHAGDLSGIPVVCRDFTARQEPGETVVLCLGRDGFAHQVVDIPFLGGDPVCAENKVLVPTSHIGGPQVAVRARPHGTGTGLCVFQNGPGVPFRLIKTGRRVLEDVHQERTVRRIGNHDPVVHVQDGTGPFPAEFGIQVPGPGVLEGMGVQSGQGIAVDEPDEFVAVVNHTSGNMLEISLE